MDFCDSENRSHIVETEKQLLGTGLSKEFEEDFNMAIGEDNTEDTYENHDEDSRDEDSIDDNEDSKEDSENESFLSVDENLTQVNSEEISAKETSMINKSKKYAADEEDEIVNEELNHSNESEQSDDEGLWEDIYGRQRDKEGHIVSKKYVPPAGRMTSNNASDDEKVRRLERQVKGILNRLAEQNMHTIANQVISY